MRHTTALVTIAVAVITLIASASPAAAHPAPRGTRVIGASLKKRVLVVDPPKQVTRYPGIGGAAPCSAVRDRQHFVKGNL